MLGSINVTNFTVETRMVPAKGNSRKGAFSSPSRYERKSCGKVELYHSGIESVSVDIFIVARDRTGRIIKKVKRSKLLRPNSKATVSFTVKSPGENVMWKVEDIHVYEVEYV